MANISQVVPPKELTDIARYILVEEEQQEQIDAEQGRIRSWAPWFTPEFTDAIKVEWDEALDTPYTPTAPFRAFDTDVTEGSLPGTREKSARMLPGGLGFTMGELDILMQRVSEGADEKELMLAASDERIKRGVIAARNRQLLVQSELVVNAQLAIDEYGIQETVTVGRASANSITSATAWSNLAGADPHDDELGAMDLLEQTYGLGWDDLVVVTDLPTYQHYRTIEAVAAELNTNRVLSGRPSRAEVNELRAGRELPPILVMNRQIQNPNGTMVKLCPTNTWMIVPRPGIVIGKTEWGSPASLSLEGVNIARDERPGPVALIEESQGIPAWKRVVVDTLSMSYVQAPNWTVNIDTQAGL